MYAQLVSRWIAIRRRGDNEEQYRLDCVDLYKRDKEFGTFIHCLDMCFYCQWATGQTCGKPENNTEEFFQLLIAKNWNLTAINRTNTTQALKLECPEKNESEDDEEEQFFLVTFIVIFVVMIACAIGMYYVIHRKKQKLQKLVNGLESIPEELQQESGNAETVDSATVTVAINDVSVNDYENLNVTPPAPSTSSSKRTTRAEQSTSGLSPDRQIAVEDMKDKIKKLWKDLLWIEVVCLLIAFIVAVYMFVASSEDEDPEVQTKAATDPNYARMKIQAGCYAKLKLSEDGKNPIGDEC